jgi:hypothetical protein
MLSNGRVFDVECAKVSGRRAKVLQAATKSASILERDKHHE